MSRSSVPDEIVEVVRAVAHDAEEEEIQVILSAYVGLRAAADRLQISEEAA